MGLLWLFFLIKPSLSQDVFLLIMFIIAIFLMRIDEIPSIFRWLYLSFMSLSLLYIFPSLRNLGFLFLVLSIILLLFEGISVSLSDLVNISEKEVSNFRTQLRDLISCYFLLVLIVVISFSFIYALLGNTSFGGIVSSNSLNAESNYNDNFITDQGILIYYSTTVFFLAPSNEYLPNGLYSRIIVLLEEFFASVVNLIILGFVVGMVVNKVYGKKENEK